MVNRPWAHFLGDLVRNSIVDVEPEAGGAGAAAAVFKQYFLPRFCLRADVP